MENPCPDTGTVMIPRPSDFLVTAWSSACSCRMLSWIYCGVPKKQARIDGSNRIEFWSFSKDRSEQKMSTGTDRACNKSTL